MYTKKKFDMHEWPACEDPPLKINFAHDVQDEYQIMKTFLVIFNVFYKHGGSKHFLKR